MRPSTLLLVLCLAFVPARSTAQVGSTTDIITGTVRNAAGQVLAGATVTVTSVETGTSRSRTTNDKGQFTILFPDGGGNYRLVARAIGQQPVTLQVAKQADEDRLVADVRFSPAATQLSTVQIQGRQGPNRQGEMRPEPGNQERALSGDQLRRLPVDPSDFASLAALSPGVVSVAGSDTAGAGFSVAGQRADANQVTLDGLSFGSGTVPQEAVRNARVITSTYDIARGQFTGGQVATTTRGGTNDLAGSFSFQLRDPSLQQQSDGSAGTGFTGAYQQLQVSGGLGGPVIRDNTFFFGSAQLRRRTEPLQSLLTAGPATLDALGVSGDSAQRLLDILRRENLPLRTGAIPLDRVADNGSLLFRMDHQLTPDHSLTVRGNWQGAVTDGFRITPQAVPAHGGEQSSTGAGALVSLSSVLGTFLNEFKGSYSRDRRGSDPYLDLPEGRVQIGSALGTGGTRSLATLDFGGNAALPVEDDGSQVEVTNELSWLGGSGRHRFKLGGLFNRQTFSTFGAGQRNGSFFFNSLSDLEADRPASFSRALTERTRSGAGINAALYLGDTWRRGQALQVTYGVRAEASSFEGAPATNPDVLQTFGRNTADFPRDVHLSPRVGFTWTLGARPAVRRDSSRAAAAGGGAPAGGGGFGGFGGGRPGAGGGMGGGAVAGGAAAGAFGQQWIVRGGVGDFRGRAPLGQFSSAIDATGLPSGQQQLVCVGSAVPVPDWSAYQRDPGSVPTRCADGGGVTTLTVARPNVTVFDPAFSAPRSVRASLGAQKRFAQRYNFNVDASVALGTALSGVRDLNLDASPKFTLDAEGGRPVFVPASTIVPGTGATTLLASRRVDRYGLVLENFSALRSRTAQLQATLGGTSFRQLVWNATYTWQRVTDQQSAGGFGAVPTAGDPNRFLTTRSDLERRHQLFTTLTWLWKPWLDMTAIFRLNSGQPYTPRIGNDINGDGRRNDAAFVFDARSVEDSAVATGMRRLLATAPAAARRCLERQTGTVAARNSCLAPWTTTLDLQFNIRPDLGKALGRRVTIQASLVNPLAGLDEALHGKGRLRGWGQPQFADANLLFVRGFDATRQRYLYSVNERFGNNNLARSALRNPFQLALQAQVQVGPDRQRQQLESFVRGGTGGGFDLRTIFARVAPTPIGPIIELRDSLKLSGSQVTRLQAIDAALTARNDALIAKVEKEVVGQTKGGGDFQSLFPKLQPHFQEGRNNFLAAVDEARKALTPEQWERLPEWIRAPSMRQGPTGRGGAGRPAGTRPQP